MASTLFCAIIKIYTNSTHYFRSFGWYIFHCYCSSSHHILAEVDSSQPRTPCAIHCSGAWPIYSRIKSTGNLNIDLSILLWRDVFVLICLSYNMYVRYFFHCVFYVGFWRLVKKAHLKELWSCLIVRAFNTVSNYLI